jgi:site-specific recombinase XerD
MTVFTTKANGTKRYCLDARGFGQGRRYFKTKIAAETALEELNAQKRTSGDVWVSMSAGERTEILAVHAEIVRAQKSLREVWEFYRQHRATSTATAKTLSEVVTEVLLAKEASGRRDTYIKRLRGYLAQFSRGRGQMLVSQFTSTDIEAWFASRSESAQTRQSALGLLSGLFQFAWRKGYIAENPCRRVEPVSVTIEAPKILTVAQCRKALKWCVAERPRFLGWLVLTMFVGLRPEAEAEKISWDEIDLKQKRIRVAGAKTKTRSHRIIDLNLIPVAVEWLELAKKLEAPLPMSHTVRRRGIRGLRAALGFKRWPADVLRHTAASNLFAYHQDAGKVAAFLGNSAGTLLKRYRALIVREEAERFFELKPG